MVLLKVFIRSENLCDVDSPADSTVEKIINVPTSRDRGFESLHACSIVSKMSCHSPSARSIFAMAAMTLDTPCLTSFSSSLRALRNSSSLTCGFLSAGIDFQCLGTRLRACVEANWRTGEGWFDIKSWRRIARDSGRGNSLRAMLRWLA